MTRPILRFAYDYIDPASWLAFNVLEEATEEGGAFENAFDLLHHPLEVRSPPRPLLDPQEPEWQAYAAEMAVEAARSGIPMNPPNVPLPTVRSQAPNPKPPLLPLVNPPEYAAWDASS